MKRPDRNTAVEMLDELREYGVSDTSMVEYLIYNWFSSDQACEFLGDVCTENDIELEEA